MTNNTKLFDKILSEENMNKAYKDSLKGVSKYDLEAMVFSIDHVTNLREFTESLANEKYSFGGYTEFHVYEPKKRVINAPRHYKDKLVQLAISNVLTEIYNPSFIFDSYACIKGKGTHACVDRIQHLMRKSAWEYGSKTTIIKCDIEKFFYSIDRDVLKIIIKKKIKCESTLKLLFHIIDSADSISPIGLPLGNTLSQLFANIYMNELDQYLKRIIGVKYYVRYMDDFFIFVENRDVAKELLSLIKFFVMEVLHMNMSYDKTKHFPLNQGLNAIGYKIHTSHRLLRDQSKRKIKRKIKAMPNLIVNNIIPIGTAEQMLNSWKGHAEHGNSYNFIQSLLTKFDFIYLDTGKNNTSLRINIEKLNKYYANQIQK